MASDLNKRLFNQFAARIKEDELSEMDPPKVGLFWYQCRICTALGLKKIHQFQWSTRLGYTNFSNHLNSKHSDHNTVIVQPDGQLDLTVMLERMGNDPYGWLVLLMDNNLPLSFVEKESVRKYVKLKPICTKTFKEYLHGTVINVEKKIKAILKDKQIALMFDGWSSSGTHFLAVFAVFPNDGKSPRSDPILLSFSPLENEASLNTESHIKGFEYVLDVYNLNMSQVCCLVGDNCPLNKSIASKLDVPMVGCMSHRLNLAVSKYMEDHEDVLGKVHKLMTRLGDIIPRAMLLQWKCGLSPVTRNKTRWSSSFKMVRRYFRMKKFFTDPSRISQLGIAEHLPSAQEDAVLLELEKHFEILDKCTKKLQEADLTLSDARIRADGIMENFDQPCFKQYLAMDSNILAPASRFFESAVTKVQNGDERSLTRQEKDVLRSLLKRSADGSSEDEVHGLDPIELYEREQKRQKSTNSSQYVPLEFIPPTTNVVERFFSRAKSVYTDYRKLMKPVTFEMIMFLKLNRDLWGPSDVARNQDVEFSDGEDE